MRLLKKGFIAALGMVAFAGAAQADEGYGYVGGQINYFNEDAGIKTVNPVALSLIGGYQMTPYVGFEGRIGTSIKDDELGNGVKVEVDHYYGAYVTGTLPLDEGLWLYALAGYTKAEAKATGFGSNASLDESDFSYGGGLKMVLGRHWEMSMEYLSMVEDLDAINLGVSYKF